MSSADININAPPFKPHMQKLRVIQNEQKVCVLPRRPRAGLDGDFFIPVLSAAFAVVLHWADMMPSHSMDLPVPRGTSILVLAGKQKMHMFVSPVVCFNEQLLFQKDGKFFSCRGHMSTRQLFKINAVIY